jgi:hypothetical protein
LRKCPHRFANFRNKTRNSPENAGHRRTANGEWKALAATAIRCFATKKISRKNQ